MTERLLSGSGRLDSVLDGGLPLHGITLLIGRPGTGKTILAQQYLFHNATAARPALYLSTVSEPLEKILWYGQSLAFSITPHLAAGSTTRTSAGSSTTRDCPECWLALPNCSSNAAPASW